MCCPSQAPKQLLTKKTNLWMAYEGIQCVIQLVALALLFMYGCQYIPQANLKPTFDAYDSDAHAPARFFLTNRNDTDVNRVEEYARNGPCADVCYMGSAAPPPPPPQQAVNAPPPTVLEYYEYDDEGQAYNVSVVVGSATGSVNSCKACLAAFRSSTGALLFRNESLPKTGRPNRWMLPQQDDPFESKPMPAGLADVARMYTDAVQAHDIFVSVQIHALAGLFCTPRVLSLGNLRLGVAPHPLAN